MDRETITCPKCGGPLQQTITVDQDDKPIFKQLKCRKKYWNKRKKGCGYLKECKI